MPPKKKAANGYKFAETLPKGTTIQDIGKKRWRLGPSIGKGGFGEIYSAQEEGSKGDKYPYVVKIEPHANGPLFVEINFYIRHAKLSEIEEFKRAKKLKSLGMPVYHGSGSHEYKGEKYRFLVMDKFASDLYKLYVDNGKVFPTDTVFKIALQLLDVLEYIHQRGYVHADIKAANILLGLSKESSNKQVYLVDFGIATKFSTEKTFKPNPKKAHDGTIEFLSRDAHQGVQTRRGDLEVLAYNLVQWLGGKLPWESNLSDPKIVQKSKEEHMSTVPKMMKASFKDRPHPKALVTFFNYLKSLSFDDEPDYNKIRKIFFAGVEEGDGSVDTPLKFSQGKTPLKRTRTPLTSKNKQVKTNDNLENDVEGDETPKAKKRGRPKKEESAEKDDVMEVGHIIPGISLNGDTTPVARKNGRGRPKKTSNGASASTGNNKIDDLESSSENDDELIHDATRKRSKPAPLRVRDARQKRARKFEETISDSEIGVQVDEAADFVTRRKKGALDKRVSKSMDVLPTSDPLAGFTDAMKEIMRKKMEKENGKKRTKKSGKSPPDSEPAQVDMNGYTEEMKAIALMKISKAKPSRKVANSVSVATTSKTSSTKGIAKPKSKRLKQKPPVTHGEVVNVSNESGSE